APVQHAVPLPTASTEMVPGVPNLYATTCGGCSAACALVVKQRDGRPIKIEGNESSPLTGGGTCAAGQASALSLYDDARLRGPVWLGNPVSWPEMDGHVRTALGAHDTRDVVLLSQTITSPSTRAVLDDLRAAFPKLRHVVYDSMSLAALREANRRCHGAAVVPHYRFDRARVVVGLEADFLGTWLAPVEFARQWAQRRTGNSERRFHVQFEAGVSVTGSNADLRLAVAPSELGTVAVALLAAVSRRVGDGGQAALWTAGLAQAVPHAAEIDRVADALVRSRGESLVVSGSDDVATQIVVARLNALLGNVGTGKVDSPVDIERPSLQRQGDDTALPALIDDMNRGAVHALIIWGANPVYDHPDGAAFRSALGKVALTISFADRRDETSAHVHAVCPDHHFLEAWGDAEGVSGHLSLRQPLIAPLHDTRAAAESLLAWAGRPSDHRTYLREFWRREVYKLATHAPGGFDDFWERSLERGVVEIPRPPVATHPFAGGWEGAVRDIITRARANRAGVEQAGYELALQETVSARDGRHANNPWLQELPDPITRLTWGNVACIAPATAAALGVATGDVVSLTTETGKLELPAFVQAGQQRRTISVAVGHGRWAAGKAGDGIGANVFPLARVENGMRRYSARVAIAKAGRRARLAPAQTHFSMEGRDIVQTISLGGSEREHEHESEHEKLPDLWKERLHGKHAWGMSIDLDACTGCSACVVACQVENNVPVVGKDQVQRNRIMHWLRIDRYFDGPDDDPASVH
ncbi:MAG TPA: molybdopterin dinucleotide binding domain-containing protein, partial [Polyangia bacterium]|nr:molybdopterin dinucleotide binding domain-containing protein [Polyangia bacterium]